MNRKRSAVFAAAMIAAQSFMLLHVSGVSADNVRHLADALTTRAAMAKSDDFNEDGRCFGVLSW